MDKIPSRESWLNVGIIGAGGIAGYHARGIVEDSPSVRLKAVCDSNPAALERFRQIFPDVAAHAEYPRLLADPDIQAVLVLLPHHLHVEVCREAAAAGKHILVEKPIARTLEEADAIIEAAEAAGVTLMVGQNERFFPVYRKVKVLLDESSLGEIFAAHIDHYQNFDRPAGHWWRSKEQVGGGCVIGSGIHRLDLLNWYLGEPEEVFAYAVDDARRLEAEAACMAVLRYRSGAVAEFFCNWGAYKAPPSRICLGEGLSVFGKEGSLYVMDEQTLAVAYPGKEGQRPQIEEVSADDGFPSLWEHFAACIKMRKPPLTDAAVGRKALELVLAIYRSLDTKRPVAFPLER
jgi:predicted dehydrogenase